MDRMLTPPKRSATMFESLLALKWPFGESIADKDAGMAMPMDSSTSRTSVSAPSHSLNIVQLLAARETGGLAARDPAYATLTTGNANTSTADKSQLLNIRHSALSTSFAHILRFENSSLEGSLAPLESRPVALAKPSIPNVEPHLPREHSLMRMAAERVPATLQERPMNTTSCDKIFSAHWLDEGTVVLGTKCSRLTVVDIASDRRTSIPVIESTSRRPPSKSILELTASRGMHAIVVNPSGTLLATGAANSESIGVYRLPDFQPVAVLEGHTDTVFALSWLDDGQLVSGSRDHTVALWDVRKAMQSSRITTSSSNDSINTISGRAPCSIEATLVRTDHQNKVRCLKHDSRSARFLTLSADATVKEWDAQRMEVVSTMAIQRPQDAVCMELDTERGLCAVGSYTHVSLADPRSSNSTVHEFDYKKSEPLGARSLALSSHILVVGGCQGRLFFYDLRAQRFLDMGRRGATDIAEGATWRMSGENVGSQRYRPFHTASSGWLHPDPLLQTHFTSMGVSPQHAVYALAYDPTRTRLLGAGGPLQVGLKGSFAAIWA